MKFSLQDERELSPGLEVHCWQKAEMDQAETRELPKEDGNDGAHQRFLQHDFWEVRSSSASVDERDD